MTCRLCGQRRARRACPALGHDICAVCCGSKRLGEINCPASCGYLAAAREHPPATAVRQQRRDLDTAMHLVRDFNQRQSQIFFLTATFLVRYQPPELHPLVDEDVAEAAAALAATFETSARGVIYEHPATTAAGGRLAAALKPRLTESGHGGGTAFERDTAVVLRRVEEAARHRQGFDDAGPRALVELLGRVIRPGSGDTDDPGNHNADPGPPEPSRLIVP
jgi:hypothetical protein